MPPSSADAAPGATPAWPSDAASLRELASVAAIVLLGLAFWAYAGQL